MQIHMCEPTGDILVFLTGEEEIEDAGKKIAKECAQGGDSVSAAPVTHLMPILGLHSYHLQLNGSGVWAAVINVSCHLPVSPAGWFAR